MGNSGNRSQTRWAGWGDLDVVGQTGSLDGLNDQMGGGAPVHGAPLLDGRGGRMQLSIDHRLHGEMVIVTVSGEIDVLSSGQLREYLHALIKDGRVHLVVDLSGVEFLDSTGLGVLVAVHHRLQASDGSMVFVGATERVRNVFHITRLTRVFPLFDTLDEALEASAGFPDAAT
jgi:anti-sigma B factor antagonist